MLNFNDLTPTSVKLGPEGPILRWRCGDQIMETDFDRFRPVHMRVMPEDQQVRVTWRDFGDLPMQRTFFFMTMNAAKTAPWRAGLFQTDLDIVERVGARAGGLPFSGAIFHMARTGSTLVHRLLSASGKVMSLSEVPMMNIALNKATELPADRRDSALRAVIAAYARPRRPTDQHLVIKMQDVPAKRLPIFRAAFPTTPWIFIYRDPLEVMVSLIRKPTGTMQQWYHNRVSVSRMLGLPGLADGGLWPADFAARTLRMFCSSALDAAKAAPPGDFLAVSYRRLPEAVWETIGPHFGIEFSGKEIDVMRAASRYSAKDGGKVEFKPDSKSKNEQAGPLARALAERLVAPIVRQFEALPQG
jgi:hypothetical protein